MLPYINSSYQTRLAKGGGRAWRMVLDLVQEIIHLSRVQDSDPLQLAQEVSVEYVIREAIDQCQITADSRNITVTYLEISEAKVLGDRDQLIMAVHNLIENAIKYSPNGKSIKIKSK